jgi:lysozyme
MAASEKAKAVALIAAALAGPCEGLRQYVYFDPVGIPTACFGTTGPDVIPGKFYTVGECKALLNRDMLKFAVKVEECAPGIPQSVHVAFSDAAYNGGEKIACDTKNSTAARYLKAGDWRRACMELPRWNKAKKMGVLITLPGLTTRRGIEMDYCLKGLT